MIGTRSYEAIEYIYSGDSALDKDDIAFDFEAFIRDGDRKHLPLKAGAVPTVFSLRKLNHKQFLRVLSRPREEQTIEAIAFGLVGVTNFMVNGSPLEIKRKRCDLGERLDPDCIEKLFSMELMAELGPRILGLSTLDPTYGQG